jgi:hypothetical protein
MRHPRFMAGATAVLAIAGLTACQDDTLTNAAPDGALDAPQFNVSGGDAEQVADFIDQVNERLAAEGAGHRLGVVEYITTGENEQIGRTVFFRNLGNKQLAHDFVPGDPRRNGTTDIQWFNDTFDGATSSGLTAAQTATAIGAAMGTWQDVTCSTIPLNFIGNFNVDLGFVQYLQGFGGLNGVLFDITHAGFLPGGFFDTLAPGGSTFILGVTFTFIWVDGSDPTDIDNNGKLDTAFREIYYNDAFPWNIGSTFDVETVALHEAGHGLSQAHFGTAFGTDANGKVHFSPRAVMNAAYSGVQVDIAKSDNAGHCSNWAQWPNN